MKEKTIKQVWVVSRMRLFEVYKWLTVKMYGTLTLHSENET